MNAVPERQGQPRQPQCLGKITQWDLDELMCEGVVVRQFIPSFTERRGD